MRIRGSRSSSCIRKNKEEEDTDKEDEDKGDDVDDDTRAHAREKSDETLLIRPSYDV